MSRAAESTIARAIAAAFLAASLAKVFVHEPWRDEWGPWGVASASRTVGELWEALRYGGHPRSWGVCVFALERATGRFESVQILAALIATGAVWTFARFAPFPRWVKVLFAFGYYPLFEYGSIARPYGVALLAAFAAVALFRSARRRPTGFAGALFVLAQTSVFGVILATAFAAAWGVDLARAARAERADGRRIAVAAALVAAGVVFAVFQMIPPADGNFAVGWRTGIDGASVLETAGLAARGILPIPRFELHFWNTHVLQDHAAAAAVAGAAILLIAGLVVARRRSAAVFLAVAAAGQLAFHYVKYEGFARHHGHLFIALVVALWLAEETASDPESRQSRVRRALLGFVLAVNAAAGVFAVAMDAVRPFSTARAAADVIRARGLADLPAVGGRATTSAAVAAALGRPFVLAGTGRTSTFVQWDASYAVATPADALREARDLAKSTGSRVLLVLDAPLGELPADVELIETMAPSIVRAEQFRIYVVRP